MSLESPPEILLQDIPFDIRSLATQKRNNERLLAKLNDFARFGQVKELGANNFCTFSRRNSADCGRWKFVREQPTRAQVQEKIDSLQSQIDSLLEQQRKEEAQKRANEQQRIDEEDKLTKPTQVQEQKKINPLIILGGLGLALLL